MLTYNILDIEKNPRIQNLIQISPKVYSQTDGGMGHSWQNFLCIQAEILDNQEMYISAKP